MGVQEAVRMLRSGGKCGALIPSGADIRSLLPVLLAGGAECEAAVVRVREVVDGLVARGDWDGVYRVMWQLRMESGLSQPDDLDARVRQLLGDVRQAVTNHVLSNTVELERIVKGLG